MAGDRHAYGLSNPVRYVDPSGHDVDCAIGDYYCGERSRARYHSYSLHRTSQRRDDWEALRLRLALEEHFDQMRRPLTEGLPASVEERGAYLLLNRKLASTYDYYGYDLQEIAAEPRDNPVDPEMFADYFETRADVNIPEIGYRGSHEYLAGRLNAGRNNPLAVELLTVLRLSHNNTTNYEPQTILTR